MHDTLDYLHKDPVYRRYAHHQMTFGLMYAWSERFILPLSHDEVVHLKGSLLGKMSGDPWRRFANLRALCTAGCGRTPARSCSSWAASSPTSANGRTSRSSTGGCSRTRRTPACKRLMADLGALYAAAPALWELDESPNGFQWIDAGNADQNVLSFVRRDAHGHPGDRLHRQLRPRRPVRLPGGPAARPATGPRCSTPIPTTTAAAASATWARSRPRPSPCTPSRTRRGSPCPRSRVLWLAPPSPLTHCLTRT